jgi:hypothetical protein
VRQGQGDEVGLPTLVEWRRVSQDVRVGHHSTQARQEANARVRVSRGEGEETRRDEGRTGDRRLHEEENKVERYKRPRVAGRLSLFTGNYSGLTLRTAQETDPKEPQPC